MHCRFKLFVFIFMIFSFPVFCEKNDLKFNSWELIIYRPENSVPMNYVRCWFKAEDENGRDVTYEKIKATYEWTSIPDRVNHYQKRYYLDGGMAMHLLIQKGKYRFSFYTPEDQQWGVKSAKKGLWESNVFEYDTENPAKVLFVYPTANDNGFYDGGWVLDCKAPRWHKFTKPKMR